MLDIFTLQRVYFRDYQDFGPIKVTGLGNLKQFGLVHLAFRFDDDSPTLRALINICTSLFRAGSPFHYLIRILVVKDTYSQVVTERKEY